MREYQALSVAVLPGFTELGHADGGAKKEIDVGSSGILNALIRVIDFWQCQRLLQSRQGQLLMQRPVVVHP